VIHPNTKLVNIDEEIGLGLIATSFIPAGTITWVKDPLDQILSRDEFIALPYSLKKMVMEYSYETAQGTRLLCWDIAKYMNHSCECNCYITPWDFEIAIKDIEKGEQLTNDYGSMFLVSEEIFECKCGAKNCRGSNMNFIGDEALKLMDGKFEAAIACAPNMSQALTPLFHLNTKLASLFGEYRV
jgi:uncharacterized protein